MAVRPQEELPGLEGSSEVIPSLSLPPGRTAPPLPTCTHRGLPKLRLSKDGDYPASASTSESRGFIPSSGTFLRFNLDPLCFGPQPVACVSRGLVSSVPLLQRSAYWPAFEYSQGLSQAPLLHCLSSRPRKVGLGLGHLVSFCDTFLLSQGPQSCPSPKGGCARRTPSGANPSQTEEAL